MIERTSSMYAPIGLRREGDLRGGGYPCGVVTAGGGVLRGEAGMSGAAASGRPRLILGEVGRVRQRHPTRFR